MSTSPRPIKPPLPLFWVLTGLIGALFLAVPVLALVTRVPWHNLSGSLASAQVAQLLRVTLSSAIMSTVLATFLGLAIALWISTLNRFKNLARLVAYLPLALPPVTAGLALGAAFGRRGLTAPLLEQFNLHFAFAFPGVVLAHLFITLPFVVATTDQALRQVDPEIITSARSLGLRPAAVLRKITLPTITPALLSGAALAFSRSLGEFGTTLTFAGSMPGVTRTMPIGIYLARETSADTAYALSALLILLAIFSLLLAALPWFFSRAQPPQAVNLEDIDLSALAKITRPRSNGVPVSITYQEKDITFPASRLSTIIGPNGSGKTTLARALSGQVELPELRVKPPSGAAPGLVMLTQNAALPRFCSVSKAINMVSRDKGLTAQLLTIAGMQSLADVKVSQLSGGQAAQVAILRALATRPAVLILDEPFSAIDVARAGQWRAFIHATAPERTTIMVTHDLRDLLRSSHFTLVMDTGAPYSCGPSREILEFPSNDFVSALAGRNLIHATVVSCADSQVDISIAGQIITCPLAPGLSPSPGDTLQLTFPQHAVQLLDPQASARETGTRKNGNVIVSTHIESITPTSMDDAQIRLRVGSDYLTVPVSDFRGNHDFLLPGAKIQISLHTQEVTAYSPKIL